MQFTKGLLVVGFATVMSLLTQAAEAATAQPCSLGLPDPSDRVTGTTGCEFMTELAMHSDYSDVFFGGNFVEIDRVEDGLAGQGYLQTSGGLSSGTFSIAASLTAIYDTFILVFKAGTDSNTLPGEAVAYVVGATLDGSYLSPFSKSTGNCDGTAYSALNRGTTVDCTRQISHIALLARVEEPSPVPLPAGLPLLMTAGAAFWVMRRRAAQA